MAPTIWRYVEMRQCMGGQWQSWHSRWGSEFKSLATTLRWSAGAHIAICGGGIVGVSLAERLQHPTIIFQLWLRQVAKQVQVTAIAKQHSDEKQRFIEPFLVWLRVAEGTPSWAAAVFNQGQVNWGRPSEQSVGVAFHRTPGCASFGGTLVPFHNRGGSPDSSAVA